MKRRYIAVLALLVAFGCKKKNEHFNMHHDYFGNEQGRYVIYNAKEINHLGPDSNIVTIYQLKTVIGDTVHDNAGNVGNKFLRYVRTAGSSDWTLKDVWFIDIVNNQAILVEENEKAVKLVFAPTETKEWNLNAYNTLEPTQCYYEDIHSPYSIGGFQLDSTLRVVQDDQFNLISLRRKYEIYAKNIGLVKKHYQHLNINNFDVTKPSSGKELFLDMIDHGKQ